MKRLSIEDMPIRITHSNNKRNMNNLYSIFCSIIDREMIKDNQGIKDDKDEKKCMSNEG